MKKIIVLFLVSCILSNISKADEKKVLSSDVAVSKKIIPAARSFYSGIIENFKLNIKKGNDVCESIDNLFIETKLKKDYLVNIKNTKYILDGLFEARQLLVKESINNPKLCNGEWSKKYLTIQALEKIIVMNSSEIIQLNFNRYKESKSNFLVKDFFKNRFYKGESNSQFKNGDLILFNKILPVFESGKWLVNDALGFDGMGFVDISSGKPKLIHIDRQKGLSSVDLESFWNDEQDPVMHFLILRHKDSAKSNLALAKAQEILKSIPEVQLSSFFDNEFDLKDRKKMYSAELVYNIFLTVDPKFSKTFQINSRAIDSKNLLGTIINNSSSQIILESSFINSGSFLILGEVKIAALERVGQLHSLWKYLLENKSENLIKLITAESNLATQLWPIRKTNEGIQKLASIGLEKKFINSDNARDAVGSSRINHLMRVCFTEVQITDFKSKFIDKKNWLSQEELKSQFTKCLESTKLKF